MVELVLVVPSMTCRHCARTVSAAVRDVAGVRTVAVDSRAGTVVVAGEMSPLAVYAALDAAGYPAWQPQAGQR